MSDPGKVRIHDDDCDEILTTDGWCRRCRFTPDAQSVAIVDVRKALAELRHLRARRAADLSAEDVEALRAFADKHRCAMFREKCTDPLCAEDVPAIVILDRLTNGATP